MAFEGMVFLMEKPSHHELTQEEYAVTKQISHRQLTRLISLNKGKHVYQLRRNVTHFLRTQIESDTGDVIKSRIYQRALSKGVDVIDLQWIYNTLLVHNN